MTCPVRTVQAWLGALGDYDRSSGPLFVRIDRRGGLGRTPTGRGSSDGRLTGQAVALIVARTATAAGLDPTAAWSGHSLRRGFATETYRTGADPLRIARAGGWKDGSATSARPSSRTSAGRASLVDPVRDAETRPWRHEDAVRHVPGWFAARLAPWRTDPTDRTSPPGRSPTERREAARRHELAVRRAARDREARLHGLVDDQGRPTAAPGPDEQARHADAVRAQLRAARSIPR